MKVTNTSTHNVAEIHDHKLLHWNSAEIIIDHGDWKMPSVQRALNHLSSTYNLGFRIHAPIPGNWLIEYGNTVHHMTLRYTKLRRP